MSELLDRLELQRKPYRATFLWIGTLLSICWATELLGHGLAALGMASPWTRDILGLVAVGTLCFASTLVISRANRFTFVRILLITGVVMLALFQLTDVLDEVEILKPYALFGKTFALQQIVQHFFLVSGTLLLALAFYLAVLDGDLATSRLEAEHALLLENMAERERAEAALLEIRAALEREVESRTLELAERNQQLQVELSERVRFEETLARKLRYEEGLASCSNVLLTEAEPEEIVPQALGHLLQATQCNRVYLFENGYATEEGPYAEMTHAVQANDVSHWPLKPGLRIHYNQGLHRWREALAHGESLEGQLSQVPISERPMLQRLGATSLLLLPISWEGRWRGFVGFDEVKRERHWAPEETRMLRTAADMIGACKERQRAYRALQHAYDELERRVDDRTSDLTRANDQLSREVADRRKAEQEKRKLEQQLRQAQKMQAIGTLAGGIAHDFNNILASIIGYTELGLRRADAADASKANPVKYFSEVLKAANRARELVRQILIFSRQNDAERVPVFPHLIAQEVIALMRSSCPANIKIARHLNAESGTVLGDPIQMHQVLLNLCTNAQHAMKQFGGTIDLSVDAIDVDTEIHTSHGTLKPGSYVLITVADTGHGMDPHTLERIFEPFFTTKSVSEGTGMGLAIVHGIVVHQGGAITVQSTIDRGTSFQVYLPRFDGPVPEVNSVRNEALRGAERIMVVDDEPQLVALWSELLEGYGYAVTGFSSSLGALASFRDEPDHFDLVLLDQIMPGMTGADLAKNMLRERPGLPIIMATGFSDEITPEVARSMGIAEFVFKPILGNDLATAVRKAIDRAVASTN